MKINGTFLLIQSIITITSQLLASGFLDIDQPQSSPQNVVINIWNHDIGPVKGGLFFKDQAIVRNTVSGKQCGSGLFQIPKYNNTENTTISSWEGGYPLFDIHISLTITKTNGDEILFDERLKLPGEATTINTGTSRKSIKRINAILKADFYAFTTGGGSVWISRYFMNDISDEAAIIQRKINSETATNIVASWPTTITYHDLTPLLIFEHRDSYIPSFTRNDLDSNWKRNLGLLVDKHDPLSNYGTCYPTRSFNREYDGTSKTDDYYHLGEDFGFYAGHSLEANPYMSPEELEQKQKEYQDSLQAKQLTEVVNSDENTIKN